MIYTFGCFRSYFQGFCFLIDCWCLGLFIRQLTLNKFKLKLITQFYQNAWRKAENSVNPCPLSQLTDLSSAKGFVETKLLLSFDWVRLLFKCIKCVSIIKTFILIYLILQLLGDADVTQASCWKPGLGPGVTLWVLPAVRVDAIFLAHCELFGSCKSVSSICDAHPQVCKKI